MTTNNTPQQLPPRAASLVKRWGVSRRKARSVLVAFLQTLVHAVPAQVGQQVAVRHQQKRRPLALVLMMALLILVSRVLWLAKLPWYIVAIPVMLSGTGLITGLIIVGYAAKWTGFGEYTSRHRAHTEFQRSKTLWDWLQLLLIPVLLAAGGVGFQAQQHTNDQIIAKANRDKDMQIASDQQQEATLNAYLDGMTTLLLDKKLGSQAAADKAASAEAAVVAKERTLTTLRRLHDGRNKTVLQFLQDAHLIGIQDAVINLSNADLSNDDLSGANLSGTDLSGTDLSGTDLSGTDLSSANLSSANLSSVNLSSANLNSTILSDATLSNANLSDAILTYAILSDATLSNANLSNANLSSADLSYVNLSNASLNKSTLNGAIMNGVDLSSTILNGAILIEANLSSANLSSASLNNSTLSYAILNGAILNGAILNGANLSGVRNLTQQQLDEVYSCTNVTLSAGLTCHRNQ